MLNISILKELFTCFFWHEYVRMDQFGHIKELKDVDQFGVHVKFGDEKPVEDYVQEHKTDPLAIVGGMATVFAVAGVLFALPMIASAGGQPSSSVQTNVEPFEYIEARLLKFGKIKDENAMPDRIVPALPTAPENIIALDRNENKPAPEETKPKERRQADAVTDDKLRQVFDKARAFAEVQDDFIPEGHPDGVPDGDVTDPALASLGATYGRRITGLFTERWVVPTLLGDAQLDKLKAKVHIRVDIDMMIIEVKMLKRSGNAMFDDSVQNAIDRVRLEVRTLPSPPEAIASNVFGGGIVIKFNGSDA
jgi:TonB C terminal